jgi:hypothetical protein
MTPGQAEVARQIERAYPGYHVFVSDEGWWYATRVSSRARGQSPTVCGADPDELTWELSAEDTTATRAHQATLTALT